MITFTIPMLKQAAKKAYDEKRLTAQHYEGRCLYTQRIGDKDYVCAIGAALPADLLTDLAFNEKANRISVGGDLHASRWTFEDEDTRQFAKKLQGAHDRWTQGGSPGAKTEFLELIST